MVPLVEQMSEALERAEGALWGGEVGDATTLQCIYRMPKASQRLMDLQEAAATTGAQYVLARLWACHPGWSAHGVVTMEPEARATQGYYDDAESVASFAATESRCRA